MPSTLEALRRSVIADPVDRTVRLVYADALDETGLPEHVARAEFIRTQIGLDAAPESNAQHGLLASRCEALFDEHWLEWWRPVCAAAKLPAPHIPGKRQRGQVVRPIRR